MGDSFDVELARLVRVLESAPTTSDADARAAFDVLSRLVEADNRARGLTSAAPSSASFSHLAPLLQTVAFDAQAAGADVEALTETVADARRALTASGSRSSFSTA